MSLRRSSLPDPADALRSAVPAGLLLLAAALPGASVVVLVVLAAGLTVAAGRGAPVRWSWAAVVPVAVTLAWARLVPAAAARGGNDCVSLASPPVTTGLAEAALGLAIVAALATLLGASARDLALRRPARRVVRAALVGAGVLAVAGVAGVLVLGDAPVGGPPVVVRDAAFLAPAVVFALALGAMEEVAYRGALLHWLGRNVGIWVALAVQALVYGVAHGAADAGAPLLSGTVLGAGALVAGVITIRTRSLLVPIAWHAALNLALYASLACRG